MTIKNGWTDDRESTARTLYAMDYNIACKQQIIDKLLADNQRLEEVIKRLREEVVFLEHLRETALTKNRKGKFEGGENDSNLQTS